MRGGTRERARSCRDRSWLFGLQCCRGIWPEDSASSPPATRRRPPSLETDTERFGIQEHFFYTEWSEHLVYRCWIRTKASADYPQMTFSLKSLTFKFSRMFLQDASTILFPKNGFKKDMSLNSSNYYSSRLSACTGSQEDFKRGRSKSLHPCWPSRELTRNPNKNKTFVCLMMIIKWNPLIPTAIHLGISIQCQDLLFRVQQLACICNIDGRLLLVTCQHPNLQAGLAQASYGFRDTILEPVLNACRSWEREKTWVNLSVRK